LMGTGVGLAGQESGGRVGGWVLNQNEMFLWFKPRPLVGHPDLLLTLVSLAQADTMTQFCHHD
jgi:hypothetical protein